MLKSESFWASYAFKTTCRSNKEIEYEGLLLETPKYLLEELERYPKQGKYVIIYKDK